MGPFPVFGPSPLSVPFWAGDGPWAMELGSLGVGRAQSHSMGPLPGLPTCHGAWCFTPSIRTGTARLPSLSWLCPGLAPSTLRARTSPRVSPAARLCHLHPPGHSRGATRDPVCLSLGSSCAWRGQGPLPVSAPLLPALAFPAHPMGKGPSHLGRWQGGLGCAAMSTPTQTQAHRALLVSWPKGSPAVP